MSCALCGGDAPPGQAVCARCRALPSALTISLDRESGTGPLEPGTARRRFAPGDSLGDRYTIVEEVGRGGMGEVYKALDRRLGRTVALKLIRPRVAQQDGAFGRFLRELALAQGVTHPNVCRVHDLGDHQGMPYLSMEFVEGQTLKDLIQSLGHLSVHQTLALGRQICAGLEAVHGQAIVHRDLKPGNVMVARNGQARVMDFGMAYRAGDDHVTRAGDVVGTLAYLSPEQARGEAVGAASDLYSVGLLLFEMLTGRRPPGDDGWLPLALRDTSEGCPPPSALTPGVPPALDAVVLRCLERPPARRFASAKELGHALSTVAEPGAPEPALAGLGRTRPSLWATSLLAATAAVFFAAVSVDQSQAHAPQAAPPRRLLVAVLPLSNIGGDPAAGYLGVGIADALVTRLAGLPGLTVVSPAATLEYRGPQDAPRIRKDLGVTFLVTGGLQRSERRLRVTLNLVRSDDSLAWGGEYEGSLDDPFSLQARLAEGVAAAFRLTLTEGQRERLSRSPTDDPGAFEDFARGRALLERPEIPGNVSRSVEAFESAIRRDPRFALAHAALGEAYWTQYKETKDPAFTTKAFDSVTEGLRLDPAEPRIRFALASLDEGTGRLGAATEELTSVLASQPGNDDAHRLLGDILGAQGRWDEALAELRKAVSVRPDYGANQRHLGYAYMRTGRYRDAAETFRRLTELEPDNNRAFQMLGTAYQAAGDDRLALTQYEHALRIRPDALAHSNMGMIYYGEKRFREAAAAFERASRLDPDTPGIFRNLGDALERLGDHPKAVEAYGRAIRLTEKLLEVNPHDALTLARLAVYEAKVRRGEEARRHVGQARSLSPRDAEIVYRVAVVEALTGEPEAALSSLAEALQQGYSPTLAAHDDDLVSLQSQPRFRELVSRNF